MFFIKLLPSAFRFYVRVFASGRLAAVNKWNKFSGFRRDFRSEQFSILQTLEGPSYRNNSGRWWSSFSDFRGLFPAGLAVVYCDLHSTHKEKRFFRTVKYGVDQDVKK